MHGRDERGCIWISTISVRGRANCWLTVGLTVLVLVGSVCEHPTCTILVINAYENEFSALSYVLSGMGVGRAPRWCG